MATVLRSDFAEASVGLTLPAQRKNLAKLHDWLVVDQRLPDTEQVVALTNYQQGRFGRLPSHVLLVTSGRLAYTHDGGMRSVPLSDVDTSRLGLKAGVVNGELTIVLRSGESTTFRRGMSLGIQEVATALRNAHRPAPAAPEAPHHDSRPPVPEAPVSPRTTSEDVSRSRSAPEPGPVEEPQMDDPKNPSWEERTQRGYGDNIVSFVDTVTVPTPIAVTGGPSGIGVFAVWALGPSLEKVDLLVNTSDQYDGVVLVGYPQAARALSVECSGPWAVTMMTPEELPVLGTGCNGAGDAVIMVHPDLSPTTDGIIVEVAIAGSQSPAASSLWAWGDSSALLVNDEAPYGGVVVIPPGTQYLTLTAPAGWVLQPR